MYRPPSLGASAYNRNRAQPTALLASFSQKLLVDCCSVIAFADVAFERSRRDNFLDRVADHVTTLAKIVTIFLKNKYSLCHNKCE